MTDGLLQLEGVSRSFDGVRAVDDVGFEVPGQAVFGLIGPNGAGKTTLVNLITAYLRVDAGSIRLAGRPITDSAQHRLAHLGIARTYQNLQLFEELTVLDNVLIGRHNSFHGRPWQLWRTRRAEERGQREHALAVLDRVGLSDLARQLVADLPYGLRRRVEIARALATEPMLLLLDEPTAGMTRRESDDIGELIRAIRDEGITVILVEHNVRLVTEVCDEIAVLNSGRLLALGEPESVWSDDAVRAAYLGGTGAVTGADQ